MEDVVCGIGKTLENAKVLLNNTKKIGSVILLKIFRKLADRKQIEH